MAIKRDFIALGENWNFDYSNSKNNMLCWECFSSKMKVSGGADVDNSAILNKLKYIIKS